MKKEDIPQLIFISAIIILVLTLFLHEKSFTQQEQVIGLYTKSERPIYLNPIYLGSGELKIEIISDTPIIVKIYSMELAITKNVIYEEKVEDYTSITLSNVLPTYYIVSIKVDKETVKIEDEALISISIETTSYRLILTSILGIILSLPFSYKKIWKALVRKPL